MSATTNGNDQRIILRPVELSPAEAALAYLLVMGASIPGARVKDAAALLTKCEAAMEPPPPATPALESEEPA